MGVPDLVQPRVLITGANGFIGAALLERLQCELFAVTGVARGQGDSSRLVRGPTLAGDADWRDLLAGTQVVVHTAARVHVTICYRTPTLKDTHKARQLNQS
jgi:UDP-glucose 4-epimerase